MCFPRLRGLKKKKISQECIFLKQTYAFVPKFLEEYKGCLPRKISAFGDLV